jgi:hypothetical protein
MIEGVAVGGSMRVFRTIIVLLILLCLAPLCVLLIAGLIARRSGCAINPDTPETCNILGGDYGTTLYRMADFGWLTVPAVPIIAALVICWIVVEVLSPAAGPARPLDQTQSRVRGLPAKF